MRVTGVAEAARGYDRHDHLCWAFDELGEFHSRALEFLTDGLAQGQRVCYAATSDTAALWDDLQDLEEMNRARRPGAVQVQSLDNRYVTGTVVDRAAASLSGDLDLASFDLFLMALQRADLQPTGGDLVIDATELEFIDYRSLLALRSTPGAATQQLCCRPAFPARRG
ncbi:MAG TPA: MEDS domain-containing protein [Mycobacteriales bacterium]|nr:MEDS domain-containing protein [Mycobacteriales bacterium]